MHNDFISFCALSEAKGMEIIMQETKLDPRVLRTRQLIQDAFKSLIQSKDINNITVGDIAERAKVNRATFYAHFVDKYELVEDTLALMFKQSFSEKLQGDVELNNQTIKTIIVAVICPTM
jgi:AcrR family transcriptional regulator